MEFLVRYLQLVETPTYQMKEHCDTNHNDMRKIGRVLESGTEEVFFYIILLIFFMTEWCMTELCMTEIVHD